MIFVHAVLWILIILYPQRLCYGQCDSESYFYCNIRIANMTSDGGARLRKAFDVGKLVQIEKMVVSISPSGPFLQRFTNFVDSIRYMTYREAAFHVPDGNTIGEIDIFTAPALRALVAGSNTYLKNLMISECSLDRLPPTLPKLTSLESLFITQCKLVVLRLDMLIENQSLKSLTLPYNQIRQLIPITSSPRKMLTIESLVLFDNQLQRLDLSMFVFMPKLDYLDVRQNLIVSLDASAAVAIPMLARVELANNKITSSDLRNLTLPSLQSINLASNALQQMPSLPRSLPKLNLLSLFKNYMTQLDMSFFRSYGILREIDVSSNHISLVRTSSPVRLALTTLSLENNRITMFNITGLEMPNISSLILTNNRLSAVPPVFNSYPTVSLTMDGNPLTCNTLLPFKDKLKNNNLRKDQTPLSIACRTTSSFVVGEETKVCCDN